MELLDRYLYEIKRYLPKDQQDDITAEISDAIQSKMEERRDELGRALTGDEEAAIIKAFGHPKITAARYQPAQYLIGPEIFPFYWYTIKIVLVAVLALELAGAAIAAVVSHAPMESFSQALMAHVWPSIFLVFGAVTFIFAAIERTGSSDAILAKLGMDRWNPRALPAVTGEEISRGKSLFEAFVNIVVLLFILNIAGVRGLGLLFLGRGGQFVGKFAFSPAWHTYFVMWFVATLLMVVMDFALIVRPEWGRLRTATMLVSNLLMVTAVCLLLTAGTLVLLPHGGSYAVALPMLNQIVFVALGVFGAGCAIAAIFNLRALLRRRERANFNVSYGGAP